MKNKVTDPFAGFTTMGGYDDCVIGIVEQFGRDDILCYDRNKIIDKLMATGMNRQEAVEFFYYNQLGSYVGEQTPCFITMFPKSMIPKAKKARNQ